MPQRRPATDLHQTFLDIADLLEHYRTLEALAESQDRSQRGVALQLQQRQNAAGLQRRLRGLHPADLGYVLEGLEPAERLQIWHHSAVELSGRLESNGLISRSRGAADRRQVLLRLTLRGERLLSDLSSTHQQELRTAAPRLISALAP